MDVRRVNPFTGFFATITPQPGFGNMQRGNLSVEGQELTYSGVIIIVGIVGAIKGNVVYCIGTEAAEKIVSTMMMSMSVDTLNEMSRSALSELTNMLTVNIATSLFNAGTTMDISTLTLFYGKNVPAKTSPNQVLCIQLLADEYPIEVNIAFENQKMLLLWFTK